MFKAHKKHRIDSRAVLVGLLSLAWGRATLAALPPPADPGQESVRKVESSGSSPTGSSTSGKRPTTETIFMFPPILIGGKIAYDIRSDASEGQKNVQRGITGTIMAKTRTYLWQPWFAQLSGDVGLNILKHKSTSQVTGNDAENNPFFRDLTLGGKNLVTTGSIRLNILPRTAYPFAAHFSKSDNRISDSLTSTAAYASRIFGVSQGLSTPLGDGTVAWDRNTQTSASSGETSQDALRLSMSKALSEAQNLNVNVNRTDNRHSRTGERAIQTDIMAQHGFAPDEELRIDTLANVSQADYNLRNGRTDVSVVQLSSFATWSPEEEDYTVTGGVRLMALANGGSAAQSGSSFTSRMRDANFNVGISYDFSKHLRGTALANLNMRNNMATQTVMASESAGLTYHPETIELGEFRYDWSAGTTATNIHGGLEESRTLSLQLSHGLGRSWQLSPTSMVTMSTNQGLASVVRSGDDPVQRLTHSGAVSWNTMLESGTVFVSMNASDSRSIGGPQESFQLINFQVSSNMPTGRYGSLTGSLTIQATRQEAPVYLLTSEQQMQPELYAPREGFILTSSGSISFQHARVFGVPRLRFMSDLRLNNSQLMQPVLGSPQDMETASWDNNFDYSIGRVVARINTRIAKASGKQNRSIMFTVQRGLGDF